ncbi:MAG TPA: serine hydrolase domain-containing protein, partial [Dongiaceae bacterium]|nr:serine hydrolase domain-containing protein [Dongiaceae bacterium]
VFQRAVGISLGRFLRDEVTGPLGLDMHLGVSDALFPRLAELSGSRDRPQGGRLYLFDKVLGEPESMTSKSLTNPKTLMTSSNAEAWRRMELPSANLHSTAAALATLYGKVACREGLLSNRALAHCQQEESAGDDPVLMTRTRFGPGFLLQQVGHPEAGFGPGQQAFGHPGSGGSLAFADPEQELGFGFVMNQMGPYVLVDPRPRRLVDAVYQSLARS